MIEKIKSGELKKELGQAVVEYVVLVSLMSLAALTVVQNIGGAIEERAEKIEKEVTGYDDENDETGGFGTIEIPKDSGFTKLDRERDTGN